MFCEPVSEVKLNVRLVRAKRGRYPGPVAMLLSNGFSIALSSQASAFLVHAELTLK